MEAEADPFEVKGTLATGETVTAQVTVKVVEVEEPDDPEASNDGLALWLDASDATTITADANGEVTAWKSKVGEIAATISAGSNTPTLMADVAGTGDGIHFDGSNDYLNITMPANFWNSNGEDANYTVIMYTASEETINGTDSGNKTEGVYGSVKAAQYDSVLYFHEVNVKDAWGSIHLNVAQNQINWRFSSGMNNDRGKTYVRPTNVGTTFSSTVVRKNGATDTLFIDGKEIFKGDTSKSYYPYTANNQSVGYIGRGKDNNGGTYFKGTICEILIYDRALSDAEIKEINEYLSEKYGNTTKNDLLLWLDASDSSTLTVDSSSGKVTSWKSKVGTYVANKKGDKDAAVLTSDIVEINGMNAVTFDGDDVYTINMDVFNGLTEATFVAYAASRTQWQSSSKETFEWNVQRGDLFTVNEVKPGWAKVYFGIYADAVAARFGTGTSEDYGFRQKREVTNDFTSTIVRWDGATKSYDVDVNGKDFGTGASLAGTTKNNNSIVYLGAGDDNVGWKGDLCELLIFDRALTDDEVESIQRYLDEKYTYTNDTVSTDGLLFWLDASKGVTTEDENVVKNWESQTENSYKATKKKGNAKLDETVINGHPGVVFDGSEDVLQLELASGALNGLENVTVVVYAKSKQNVVSHSNDIAYNVQRNTLFYVDESGDYGSFYVGIYKDALSARFGTGTYKDYGYYAKRPATVEDYSTTVIRWTGSNMTYDLDVDGKDYDTGTSKAGKTANNKNIVYLGTGKSNSYWTGVVGDILVYDRALSDQELQSIYNYFEEKYEPIIPDTKPVSGIYLKEEGQQITLYKGDEAQLTASTVPANADNTALTYTSSNPAVATVDENGKITAVGWGYATITVTTIDGGYSAACTVFVDKSESDKIWQNIQDILDWAEKQDETKYWNWNQTLGRVIENMDETLSASSPASELTSVYNQLRNAMKQLLGTVTYAFAEGAENQIVEAGTELSVEILPDGQYLISVQVDEITLEESQYTITSAYDNPYVSPYALRRTTSGMIITLSESYMSTITPGEHSLRVVYADEAEKVETKFTVIKSVTGVTLDQNSLTLKVEETANLIATVSPEGATDSSVTWISDDESVVTVDADGKITAVGEGSATITVTTNDGGFTATCQVEVIDPIPIPVYGAENEDQPIHAEVILNEEGIPTILDIAESELQKVIGSDVETGVVMVNVSQLPVGGMYIYVDRVDLPKTMIEHILAAAESAHNDTEALAIILDSGTVMMDDKTMREIITEVEGDTVRLVLERKTKNDLNANQKKALAGENVYDVYDASLYCVRSGKQISDFGDGRVTLSVQINLKGKSAEGFGVWYVSDDGKTLKSHKHTLQKSKLSWKTDHFSTFVIVYEEPVQEPEPSDPPVSGPSSAGSNAPTGDTAQTSLWMTMMCISVVMAVAVIAFRKKYQN